MVCRYWKKRNRVRLGRLTCSFRSFIAQVPILAAAFVAAYWILDVPQLDTSHWRDKLARVDFLGAFFLVSAVLCLLIGLDNGSNTGWDKLYTIVPLAISPALFAIFILVEIKVASHPFAPGHIIFERSVKAKPCCWGSAKLVRNTGRYLRDICATSLVSGVICRFCSFCHFFIRLSTV